MSVNVNQSEKLLSLETSVLKPKQQHSLARSDSAAADNHERQDFRSAFEKQRKERDLEIKRTVKKSIENRRESAEIQQDRVEARNAQSSRLEEKRSALRIEDEKRNEASEQFQKENSPAQREEFTASRSQREAQSEKENERVNTPSNQQIDKPVDAARREEKVEIPQSETVLRSEPLERTQTAEAAAIDDESGKLLPPNKSPEIAEKIQAGLSSESYSEYVALENTLENATTGRTLKGKALAGNVLEENVLQGNVLEQEQVTSDQAIARANDSKDPLGDRPLTQNLTPSSVQSAVTSNPEVLGNANPQTSVAIEENITSADQREIGLQKATAESGPLDVSSLDEHGESSGNEKTTMQSQQVNLPVDQDQAADVADNLKELKADEQLNPMKNYKINDQNIYAHSRISGDKNPANESKASILNEKTDPGHFVNLKSTQTTTGPQQDASLANLRQSYNPDIGRVLDAQINNLDKTNQPVVAEKAEVTEATTIAKSPIANSRWTHSIEQTQLFTKANNLQTAIPTKFNSEQWANAVADKVLWLSGQRIQSAEIRLDPPELGPMQVRVSVHQDQASIQFVSHHQSVREALDQNVFRLREMFGDEGIDLVDVNVSDRNSQQSMSDEGNSDFRGDGQDTSETDNELTQDAEVLELVNLVDHYV